MRAEGLRFGDEARAAGVFLRGDGDFSGVAARLGEVLRALAGLAGVFAGLLAGERFAGDLAGDLADDLAGDFAGERLAGDLAGDFAGEFFGLAAFARV